MPKCTKDKIGFGRLGRRVIEADFSGGDLSSDGGLLLLRQVDRHLGLSRAAAAAIPDPRDPERSATACASCWRNACTVCAAATRT